MDLTREEFADRFLLKNFTSIRSQIASGSLKKEDVRIWKGKGQKKSQYASAFDWNEKNVVTPVYDQGSCGSCWAFSTTESIESMWALAGNTLTQLSMQQIVDCDTNDHGCSGGNPPVAYDYVIDAGGLMPYSDYPYAGVQGECKFVPSEVVAKIDTWVWITEDDDESAMLEFVADYGPPSICVDATEWQYYTGGIITPQSDCGQTLDHCVQLTGWQTVDGIIVWNVRNSWGTDWGPYGGYIYIESGYDVCGIGQECTSSSA
jgi:C1A family cysteine protease